MGDEGDGDADADGDADGDDCTSRMVPTLEPAVDVCDLTTCEQVDATFRQLRESHRECSDNDDCVVTSETFDWTCDCGDVMNRDGLPGIPPLRERWDELDCDPDCSGGDCNICDCEPPPSSTCEGGRCTRSWD